MPNVRIGTPALIICRSHFIRHESEQHVNDWLMEFNEFHKLGRSDVIDAGESRRWTGEIWHNQVVHAIMAERL